MYYKIHPIYLGSKVFDMSTYLYRFPYGQEQAAMAMGAFVLEDENGEYILFDSGAPSINEIRRLDSPFAELADESIEYIDEIKKIGVDPQKIKLIILSHLHWDHAWNLQYFPNAKIVVQDDELCCAINPHKSSIRSYGHVPQTDGPDFSRHVNQLYITHGDFEIRPGIQIIRTPGHTCGSISALVNTREGLYGLVADFAMLYRNFEEELPTGTVDSVIEWYKSLNKLRSTGAILLPTHEPKVYEKKIYG